VTFDPVPVADAIVDALHQLGEPRRAAQEKRYLKSELDFLGVPLADVRRVVTAASRRHPDLTRDEIVAWAQALWDDALWERRIAAVELLSVRVRALTAADLATVEALIRAAAGWALVDPLATGIAGRIALEYPQAWPRIDAWALDQDFWVRRAALLALLPGVRAGRADLTRFDRYATPMLAEKEFFIRKAIGWVLREISKSDPGYVTDWTERHVREMSGVTFREAIRRLPAGQAARLATARL
jgi:3-methyladenine DNA glycosylase AlkD